MKNKKIIFVLAIVVTFVFCMAIGCSPKDNIVPPIKEKTKLASAVIAIEDNKQTGFNVSWQKVANSSGYKYRVIKNEQAEEWVNVDSSSTSFEIKFSDYNSGECKLAVEVVAIGNDEYNDSEIAKSTTVDIKSTIKFTSVPKNQNIKAAEGITFYIAPSGTVDYSTQLPTIAEGELNYTISMLYLAYAPNPGGKVGAVKTNYHVNGFKKGVFVGDVADGIYMKSGFAYKIEYSVENYMGLATKHVQTIIVRNDDYKDLVDTYPNMLTDATLEGGISLVDSIDEAILGAGKILRMYDKKPRELFGSNFTNTNIYVNKYFNAETNPNGLQHLGFYLYNNSDVALEVTLSGTTSLGYPDIIIQPKSYCLWNLYDNAWAGGDVKHMYTHGIISSEGYLQRIEFAVRPTEKGVLDVYIGHCLVNTNTDIAVG